MLLLGHEAENGLGILKGLRLAGGTRVLAVVGKLLAATQVTYGVTAVGITDHGIHYAVKQFYLYQSAKEEVVSLDSNAVQGHMAKNFPSVGQSSETRKY